jgi:EAL domain-containing protein (putative c-di-GMP-specific phosphodiesterase class I)
MDKILRQVRIDTAPPDRSECGQDCSDVKSLGFGFSYAFQPIVDTLGRVIFAHEALVRGEAGESASSVLSKVNPDNRYRFDQACRVKAIKTASHIGLRSRLSINFMPNAIYRPEVCIRTTLAVAGQYNFPIDQIIFETVEGERVDDGKWLAEVFHEYRRIGFRTAIDDFGAGYAGLALLADFQPDLVKLDMGLIRNIQIDPVRQTIARSMIRLCSELDISVIAEGVETFDEYRCLEDLGVRLMQGYLFSKPLFEGCILHPERLKWPGELAIA